MGIFSMLSWGSMWSVFGFISLISMIWVVGPAIQVLEYKPLEPLWSRILCTAIVCVIFLGIYIYKWYQNKKLNEHVIEELKASEVEELPTEKDSELKQQFTSIDILLQKHEKKHSNDFIENLFSDKDNYIYQKPWFLVVGAAGVGKTSAILNSGLTFPIGFEEDNASRLTGTRDCDWFLTDESLLLDTAGRFITHDNETSNTEDWNELLELLKRCRTKQPINGLVLMLSTDDILSGNDDKIKNQIQQIRLRLQELQESFKTNFPLYILINKVDLITGFTQYFNLLNEQDRKKTLGISLDPMTVTSAEKINQIVSQLDLKTEEIRNNLFDGVAYNNQEHDPSDLAMSFPSEFSIFNESFKGYLKRLLNLSKYDSDINLAGIYFTSSMQYTSEISTPTVSSDYELRPKYIDNINPTLTSKSQPYFLNQFFNSFLLNTADLAGIDNAWLKKRQKTYWLLMSIIVVVLSLCCFLLFKAYGKNNNYLSSVSGQLQTLEDDIKVQPALNILGLLNFSHHVYEIPSHNIDKTLIQKSIINNLGLYQYTDIEKASHSKYQNLIDEKFIPSVSHTIESELRKSVDLSSNVDIYQNLKAYMMLHQTEYYDKSYIGQWVVDNLNKTSENALEMDESSIAILKKMLSSRQILPNSSMDRQLIERARYILANEDIANIIYTDLEANVAIMNTDGIPKVSFVSMGGPATQSIFRRTSDKLLNDAIPPLYTKYGYENIFKPFVGKRTKDFYQKETWVLGNDFSIRPQEQVLADIYQKYTSNYVFTWREYLNDIVMVNPDSLQQTVSMAKQLSEKNSSLAGIIKGISNNTNLMSNTFVNKGTKPGNVPELAEGKIKALPKDKLMEKVNDTVKEKTNELQNNIDDSKLQGYLQNVSSNFSQFQTLTQESAESGSQLSEITSSINDLYIYAIALQRSLQNNNELMPDEKPLINYQAQVSRLPDPFKPMLNTLEFEVSQVRVNYVNDKRQKEFERLDKVAIEEEERQKQATMEEKERQKKAAMEEEAKIEREIIESAQQEEEMAIENSEQRRQFILQTAIEQDKIVQNKCKSTLAGKYPFNKLEQDLSLDEFAEIFSQKSGFLQTLGGNVAVVNEEGMTPFISLLESGQLDRGKDKRKPTYTQARKINSMYLTGANSPHLGISMKVISMDKNIENLSVTYDGQKIEYYHGPQKNYLMNWPAKKNSQFSIKATSTKSKPATLDVKGDWSVFRLLDKATKVTKTKDGKGVLAVFMLNKNKVEIEFKSASGSNPFNLFLFKDFKC